MAILQQIIWPEIFRRKFLPLQNHWASLWPAGTASWPMQFVQLLELLQNWSSNLLLSLENSLSGNWSKPFLAIHSAELANSHHLDGFLCRISWPPFCWLSGTRKILLPLCCCSLNHWCSPSLARTLLPYWITTLIARSGYSRSLLLDVFLLIPSIWSYNLSLDHQRPWLNHYQRLGSSQDSIRVSL